MTDKPPRCPQFSSCELFPLIQRPGFLRIWQINYCEATYEKCERYRLALRDKVVPITLLPNGDTLAALATEPKKTK